MKLKVLSHSHKLEMCGLSMAGLFTVIAESDRVLLTLVDFTKGSRANLFDDLEAAFQNFLSVLQHVRI